MDIFKLLSRSTKLGKNSTSKQLARKLPSGGQNANPQIFGRGNENGNALPSCDAPTPNTSAVLGKRKRPGATVSKELDFFRDGQGGGDQVTTGLDVASNGAGHAAKGNDEEEVTFHTMSEEEKRATMRAHKIKVTILEDPTSQHTVAPAKSKKPRRKEPNKEPTRRNHKPQIFPQPVTAFSQLRSRHGISRRLAENITAQGYKLPTEVQLAALPLLMGDPSVSKATDAATAAGTGGCDLLTVAPTGSGKTLAFLIPVIDAILRDPRSEKDSHTQALVLAPTRELAYQIVNEGKKLVQNTGVKISLMKKGMALAGDVQSPISGVDDFTLKDDGEHSMSEDDTAQNKASHTLVKSHIVVSTPLVLVHSLTLARKTSGPLSKLRHLVLDEADVLLDPLFREQVEAIWSRCTNPLLRITLWSATMSSSIEEIAMQHFKKLNHIGGVPILRLVVGLKDTALPTLKHTVIYTGTEAGKLIALRQLLHPSAPETDSEGRKALRPPFLVFTQTIERAKALQAELRYDIPPEAGGSARMAALHSEMSDNAREKIMTEFRKGEIWILITTDLLARGVDFRGLNGVVNYDVPTSAAAYIHRVGRTGRAGREGGVAITLYTKDDIPYVKPIANVITASEKLRGEGGVEHGRDLQQWLLDALPAISKRERKELKQRGVKARRTGEKGARISTKSGYERKMDNRRKDMQGANKSAPRVDSKQKASSPDGGFAGFSD